MIEFRAFGPTSLRGPTGSEVLSVLARPKLLSLLTVLAATKQPGFARRERLQCLLWGDSEPERARANLRQSLYRLRTSLGADAVENRGEEEVGLNTALVWCDVTAFEQCLAQGRREEALALYRGSLLEGFIPVGPADLDLWLEERRRALGGRAVEAALALAEDSTSAGHAAAAGHWARRVAALAGTDEAVTRRAMEILAEMGDRAGAVQLHAMLERRMEVELGVPPSQETRRLLVEVSGPEPPVPLVNGGRRGGEEGGDTWAAEVPMAASRPEPVSTADEPSQRAHEPTRPSRRVLPSWAPTPGSVRQRVRSNGRAASFALAALATAASWWLVSGPARERPSAESLPRGGSVSAGPVRVPASLNGLHGATTERPNTARAFRTYLRAQALDHRQALVEDLLVQRQLLDLAVAEDPEFGDAWGALAVNFMRHAGALGPTRMWADSALWAAQHALTLDPRASGAHLAMGWVYQSRGLLDRAMTSLSTAVDVDPASASAHYQRGLVQTRLGRFVGALESFLAVLRLEPDDPHVRPYLASTSAKLGDLPSAVRWSGEAVDYLDGHPATEAQMAALLHSWKREPDAALESALRMVAAAPEVPAYRSYLADLAMQAGRCDTAAEHARTALAMSTDPEGLRYFFLGTTILGGALAECGRWAEAEPYLDGSRRKLLGEVEAGSRDPFIFLELAGVSGTLGDLDTALVWFRRALELGARDVRLVEAQPLFRPLLKMTEGRLILVAMRADVRRMGREAEGVTPGFHGGTRTVSETPH